jgi:hypothetical protein
MNRAERRAFDKVARCVEAETKVPARAQRRILDQKGLKRWALGRGKRIDGRGVVREVIA